MNAQACNSCVKTQYILRDTAGHETKGVSSLPRQREGLQFAVATQPEAGWHIVRQRIQTTVIITDECRV
jgi:hypothetical protein